MAGTLVGVFVFRWLQRAGQIDIVIQVSYVLLLGTVGVMMTFEAMRTLLRRRRAQAAPGRLHQHFWVHRWPLRMRLLQAGSCHSELAFSLCIAIPRSALRRPTLMLRFSAWKRYLPACG
jgi:hypothetical protein